MPNPTRAQILNAHEALLELQSLAEDSLQSDTATIRTLGEHIVTVIPPLPRPTMAEVEWDDGEHFLAEAEQNIHGQVIMLGLDENGLIEYLVPRFHAQRYDAARPGTLTPTGRRFTLTEVQE